MLFNLVLANNFILLYFIVSLIIDLYFLIAAIIAQIFNTIVELVIPKGIPTKDRKAEMEIHPVIVESKISMCSI